MIKLIGVVVIASAVIIGVASRYIFKKSDNVVEEAAEMIIMDRTGYDIDLSPDTPDESLDMIMTPKDKEEADGENKCNK